MEYEPRPHDFAYYRLISNIIPYKERTFFHVVPLINVTGSTIIIRMDLLSQLHFIGVEITAYSPVEYASFSVITDTSCTYLVNENRLSNNGSK